MLLHPRILETWKMTLDFVLVEESSTNSEKESEYWTDSSLDATCRIQSFTQCIDNISVMSSKALLKLSKELRDHHPSFLYDLCQSPQNTIPAQIWTRFVRMYFDIPRRMQLVLDDDGSFFSNVSFAQKAAHQLKHQKCKEPMIIDRLISIIRHSHYCGTRNIWMNALLCHPSVDLTKAFFSFFKIPNLLLDSFIVDLFTEAAFTNSIHHILNLDFSLINPLLSLVVPKLSYHSAQLLVAFFHHHNQISSLLDFQLTHYWKSGTNSIDQAKLLALILGSTKSLTSHQIQYLSMGIQLRLDHLDSDHQLIGRSIANCMAFVLNQNSTESKTSSIFDLNQTDRDIQQAFDLGKHWNKTSVYCFEIDTVDQSTETASLLNLQDDDEVEEYPNRPTLLAALPKEISNVKESEAVNAKIRTPRLLLDAVEYLKSSDDPIKLDLALEHLPRLISISPMNLLDDVSAGLFRSLLFLGEDYNLKDFDSRQMHSLLLIMSRRPLLIGKECYQLLSSSNQISLIQRLLMITCTLRAILDQPSIEPAASSNQNNVMSLLDKQLNLSSFSNSTTNTFAEAHQIIQHVVIPIAPLLLSFSNNPNTGSHQLVLEKSLLLLAASISRLKNVHLHLNLPLITLALNLIRPLMESSDFEQNQPVKVQLAMSHLLYQMVHHWPFNLLTSLADLNLISSFLVRILETESTDLCNVAAHTLHHLQFELASEHSILSQAASQSSFDINPIYSIH